MTNELKAAVLMCRAAEALARIAGMHAENRQREILGESVAYPEQSFTAVIDECGIHHNAVYELLHS